MFLQDFHFRKKREGKKCTWKLESWVGVLSAASFECVYALYVRSLLVQPSKDNRSFNSHVRSYNSLPTKALGFMCLKKAWQRTDRCTKSLRTCGRETHWNPWKYYRKSGEIITPCELLTPVELSQEGAHRDLFQNIKVPSISRAMIH